MDSNDIWQWFDFADSDLEAAEHLLTLYRPRLEIICFCYKISNTYHTQRSKNQP